MKRQLMIFKRSARTSLQETSIQAAEQRDKEGRRNNLIIYKIPESDPRAEDRNHSGCQLLPIQLLTSVFM